MTDDALQACPECNSASVYPHSGRGGNSVKHDYRCATCGSKFDDPVERERKRQNSKASNVGLSRVLEEMNDE